MPKNVRPLFGTAIAFSEAAGTADINGAQIVTDYPPTDQNVASIFIHNDGTGGAVVITVKCQFYSGVDWGPLHNVEDENGSNITFSADSDTDVEANMYAQSWWKENDGWRIVLSRTSSTLLAGNATAIVR
jgi:hypothetical protein